MSISILLIAGHGAGDPGAVGQGLKEADQTRNVVNHLAPALRKHGFNVSVYDQNKNAFEEYCAGRLNFGGKFDYVFEVHFNAFNGTAKGTEAFVTTSESGTGVEQNVVNNLSKYFPSRGVKCTNFSVIAYAKSLGMSSCLYEVAFIDNKADMDVYKAKVTEIAQQMASGIATGFGVKVSNPAPTPEKPKQPTINQGSKEAGNGLFYRAHIAKQGDLGFVGTEETAGTTGKAIPVQAIEVKWKGASDQISSSGHAQSLGWLPWDYKLAGTKGKGKNLEAVRFWLGPDMVKQGYSIEYRVHVAKVGWMDWKKDGEVAGTTGKNLAIEAIQMRLRKNGKVEKGKFL